MLFRSESKTKRKYIHGGGDRFDEQYDMIRAVRDQRFKYLRNFDTAKAYYLPVAYREQMPIMQELLRLHASHQLNEYQEQWFRLSKPKEELFDTYTDPYELHNIAADVKYKSKLIELRHECDRWMNEIDDKGKMKEIDYVHSIWHGDHKPVTSDPVVLHHSNIVTMSSATPGASIGYKIIHNNSEKNVWSLFLKPIPILPGDKLKVIAHRIGYEPSRILEL